MLTFAILLTLVLTKQCMALSKSSNLCRCLDSDEARNLSSAGNAHVHCSCLLCKGKAVYPMTAWRHARRANRARTETWESQLLIPFTSSPEISDACDVEFEASASFSEIPSDLPSALLAGRQYERGENVLENESTASDDEMPIGLPSDDNSPCPSDDSSNDEEHNDSNRDDGEDEDLDQFVYDTVLRLVEIKARAGFSQSIFEDLLQWGKDIAKKVNNNITWPSCWADVLVLLEKFGYKSPNLYWICLDESHPYLFSLLSAKDELCPHCGKQGKIPYYYLSVLDKVKRWCSSPSMCQRMTAH